MKTDEILRQALSNGAITSLEGNAAAALRHVAEHDRSVAEQFASKARTPIERVELALAVVSPGTTLEAARRVSKQMGCSNPDEQLIRLYGN